MEKAKKDAITMRISCDTNRNYLYLYSLKFDRKASKYN